MDVIKRQMARDILEDFIMNTTSLLEYLEEFEEECEKNGVVIANEPYGLSELINYQVPDLEDACKAAVCVLKMFKQEQEKEKQDGCV